MRTNVLVVIVLCLGTMLYCSEFIIPHTSSKKKISQEALFRSIDRLLHRTVGLVQNVMLVQKALLDSTAFIAEHTVKQGLKKQLVNTIDRLDKVLVMCERELDMVPRFVQKIFSEYNQDKNNTK